MYKELDVLHLQKVFTPLNPDTLTTSEWSKAFESLMFVERKRMGAVKGCLVVDKQCNIYRMGS